jgi:glycosyltransferase involved in cell wall biosynthesis
MNRKTTERPTVVHVAPPFLPLDPQMKYGGIERVILSLLSKQKEISGHDILVIAPSDSTIAGLIPTVRSIGVADIYSTMIDKDEVRKNTWVKMEHVAAVLNQMQNNHDTVFHLHDDYLLPFAVNTCAPFVMTLHSPYEEFWTTETSPDVVREARGLVAISRKQKEIFESHGYQVLDVIYNGIDVELHQHSAQKDDFLLTLSAIAPHKGQHIAIDISKASGKPLIIAGNIANTQYHEAKVRPHIQYDLSCEADKLTAYRALPHGQKIVYVGPVDDEQKKPLYAKAEAFLMPILWEEPFGLVAVEALAGGTPVITMNRGALPEIVQNGETGYICDNVREMIHAVSRLHRISPHMCRRSAEERFSSKKMAERYLEIYAKITK